MATMVQDIRQYQFAAKDNLFLDTNVWFYIYGMAGFNNTIVDTYSQALKEMLEAGSRIYIDVLIISEFINTYLKQIKKTEYSRYKKYKDFRNSTDFNPIACQTATIARKILNDCKGVEDNNLAKEDIMTLLTEFGKDKLDFNDQLIAKVCRTKNLKLITHDGDFVALEVSVITANQKLLQKYQ